MESSPQRSSGGPPTPGGTKWLQLGVVSAADFVAWTGFGAVMPYLPLFLKQQAHSSLLMIGVVASMFYLGTLLFSSPLGWLSDLIGRKPVMLSGAALYTVALLLFTTTTDPYWFVLFRLLEGIGTAALGPAAQAFVADITTESERSKAYGILTSAQFGGLIAGPALAAPLYHLGGGGKSGFYAIFYLGGALSAMTLFAILAFVREPAALEVRRALRRHERAAGRAAARAARPRLKTIMSPAIIAFIIMAFTSHYAMGGFDVIWSLWLTHLGASISFVGLTWVAFSVPMLLAFAGGMLADRYSRFWLMIGGYTLSAIAWVVYGTTTDLTFFLLVNVAEGLAIAFSYPAKQALLIQVSPPRWLGTVTGLESTSMQLAGWLGSLTAPILYGWVSGYVLAIGGIVNLVGLAIAAPIIGRAWYRLKAAGPMAPHAELERLTDGARPTAAGEPPFGID